MVIRAPEVNGVKDSFGRILLNTFNAHRDINEIPLVDNYSFFEQLADQLYTYALVVHYLILTLWLSLMIKPKYQCRML